MIPRKAKRIVDTYQKKVLHAVIGEGPLVKTLAQGLEAILKEEDARAVRAPRAPKAAEPLVSLAAPNTVPDPSTLEGIDMGDISIGHFDGSPGFYYLIGTKCDVVARVNSGGGRALRYLLANQGIDVPKAQLVSVAGWSESYVYGGMQVLMSAITLSQTFRLLRFGKNNDESLHYRLERVAGGIRES